MPDKRIYNFQTSRTTPTNGLIEVKVGQIGPTFSVPGKTSNFLGSKLLYPLPYSKWGKVTKKLAPVYAHTHTPIRKYMMVGANLINLDNFDKFRQF